MITIATLIKLIKNKDAILALTKRFNYQAVKIYHAPHWHPKDVLCMFGKYSPATLVNVEQDQKLTLETELSKILECKISFSPEGSSDISGYFYFASVPLNDLDCLAKFFLQTIFPHATGAEATEEENNAIDTLLQEINPDIRRLHQNKKLMDPQLISAASTRPQQLKNVFEIIHNITTQNLDLANIIWDYYFDLKDIREKIDIAIMAGDQATAKYYCTLPNTLLRIPANINEDPYMVFIHQPWRRYGKFIFSAAAESQTTAITEYYDSSAELCFCTTEFAQSELVRILIMREIIDHNTFPDELLENCKIISNSLSTEGKIAATNKLARRLNSFALGKLMLSKTLTWEQTKKLNDAELAELEKQELKTTGLLEENQIKNLDDSQLTALQTYGVRKLIATNKLTIEAALGLNLGGCYNLTFLNIRKLIFAGLLSIETARQLGCDENGNPYCWFFQSPQVFRLILQGKLAVAEIINTTNLTVLKSLENSLIYHDIMNGTLTVAQVKKFASWQSVYGSNTDRIIWPYVSTGDIFPATAVWRLCARNQDYSETYGDSDFATDASWNLNNWCNNFILLDQDVFRLVQTRIIPMYELIYYAHLCGEQIKSLTKNSQIIYFLHNRHLNIAEIFTMISESANDPLANINLAARLIKLASERMRSAQSDTSTLTRSSNAVATTANSISFFATAVTASSNCDNISSRVTSNLPNP